MYSLTMETMMLEKPMGPVTNEDIWTALVEISRHIQALETKLPIKHETDETEYLMSNPANKKFLDEAIADIKARRNLVTVTMEQLEAMAE